MYICTFVHLYKYSYDWKTWNIERVYIDQGNDGNDGNNFLIKGASAKAACRCLLINKRHMLVYVGIC